MTKYGQKQRSGASLLLSECKSIDRSPWFAALGATAAMMAMNACYRGMNHDAGGLEDTDYSESEPGTATTADGTGPGNDGTFAETEVPLRLLTASEYENSVYALFGDELEFEPDLVPGAVVAGFRSVGSAEITVGELAAEKYETAARAIAAAVFADEQAWRDLVGCEPAPALDGPCVQSYLRGLGRRVFRRPLADEELDLWSEVAREAAELADDPVVGLRTVTSGLLQSPHFLYRVETGTVDPDSGRFRFNPFSMATRLAFTLTGTPPDDAMLDRADRGGLSSDAGLREAAEDLLATDASREHRAEFFVELASVDNVAELDKEAAQFPQFDAQLANTMVAETRTWLREVVLAPGADVRELFVSEEAFVDQRLAELYGVPGSDDFGPELTRVQLSAESGRAGIFGKASFLSRHSSPNSSAPTRRGLFILSAFLCETVPSPPPGVETELDPPGDDEAPETTRQRFERHVTEASCASCHSVMDPPGFALEDFDAIGQYRNEEFGISIDATGEFRGAFVRRRGGAGRVAE